VRLRLLVVAAFLGMAAVPVLIAFNSRLVPGPSPAAATSTSSSTTSSAVVASLAWPGEPLGLAATDTRVLWEQRDRSPEVAGLWYHDVRTGDTRRLLGRGSAGKASGFPAAAGGLVAWSSWAGRRESGPPSIQALDTASSRRWQVAAAGRDPTVTGDVVLWVEPGGAGAGDDVIRGINALTDEEYAIVPRGHVRDFACWGRWAAWISGRSSGHEVWAGSFGNPVRYRLAASGTTVAMDHDRIVWAAAAGRHSTAIVSWDRHAGRSTVLWRMPGVASSLSLSRDHAVWVTTRKPSRPRVWAYDFESGKAYPVSTADGRQVSPVIVGGTAYWADDRSGHWQLYSRSLQH
jgi:hypothetical protein